MGAGSITWTLRPRESNGEPIPLTWRDKTFEDARGRVLRRGRENLVGVEHDVLDHPNYPGLPQEPLVVPLGHYFMMGDNRDFSNDSRGWGVVPLTDMRGPAQYIYWSWNNTYSWAQMANPITWFKLLAGETRWSRFGRKVE